MSRKSQSRSPSPTIQENQKTKLTDIDSLQNRQRIHPRMRKSLITLPPEVGNIIESYFEPYGSLSFQKVRTGRGMGGLPDLPEDVKYKIMKMIAEQKFTDILEQIRDSDIEDMNMLFDEAMKWIRMGADPNIKIIGYDPTFQEDLLYYLIQFRKSKEIKELLTKYDLNPNRRIKNWYEYPLFELLSYLSVFDSRENEEEERSRLEQEQKDQIKILKTLIQNGADVNRIDSNGNTPLMNLIQMGDNNPEIIDAIHNLVKILLQNGSDIYMRNSRGLNSIQLAEQQILRRWGPYGEKILQSIMDYV